VRREAKGAFGDDRLMLERLVEPARHIEVQIFGDGEGNVVHLYERDCTTQRRRQKIVEEAPSPLLTPEQREQLTSLAVRAARATGYRSAGTVEFLADRASNFYFLEMNTRLQVEHPVTEMVTDVDLVEWQLRVASGETLPLKQHEITLRGHAIEARLCAEDPFDGFKPQTGRILYFQPPPQDGVRIDSSVRENGEVSPFYDSMLAKFVAFGRNRAEASRRLVRALEDAPLLGFATNQQFLCQLLQCDDFVQATLATSTLDRWAEEGTGLSPQPLSADIWALAAAIFAERGAGAEWFWSTGGPNAAIELVCGSEVKRLRYARARDGAIAIASCGGSVPLVLRMCEPPEVVFEISGRRRRALALWAGAQLHLSVAGASFIVEEVEGARAEDPISHGGKVMAPVAGRVVKVFAGIGQTVEAGLMLAIIEAMKMETRVVAAQGGRLTKVHAVEGAQVAQASLLFEIERQEEPADA
jgi:geranyl-CoA carboxylase alpha subunit